MLHINSNANFIDCLSKLNCVKKSYIKKTENGFEIVEDKSKKNLNTATIYQIAQQAFNHIARDNSNIHEKCSLLRSLSKSLEVYSHKSSTWPNWLCKIIAFVRKLFGCKSNLQKMETLSRDALFYTNHELKDLSLKDIQQSVLNDSRFVKLFEVTKDLTSNQIKQHLDGMDANERNALLGDLNKKYRQFLKWMRSFSALFLDPLAHQQKSQLADEVYGKYSAVIYTIAKQFEDKFTQRILPVKLHLHTKDHPPFEPFPCTALMPNGIHDLIKHFKTKMPAFDVEVCNSYQAYGKKLEQINAQPDGCYNIIVRCKDDGTNNEIHLVPVYLIKNSQGIQVFILDAATSLRKDRIHFLDNLASRTNSALPNSSVFTANLGRQYDGFNCGVFALKDILAIFKDMGRELLQISPKSEGVEKHLPFGAKVESKVRIIPTLPVKMLKLYQSLSVLQAQLSTLPETESLAKVKADIRAFTYTDPRQQKEIYAFTKFEGLKYRLQIIEDNFKL